LKGFTSSNKFFTIGIIALIGMAIINNHVNGLHSSILLLLATTSFVWIVATSYFLATTLLVWIFFPFCFGWMLLLRLFSMTKKYCSHFITHYVWLFECYFVLISFYFLFWLFVCLLIMANIDRLTIFFQLWFFVKWMKDKSPSLWCNSNNSSWWIWHATLYSKNCRFVFLFPRWMLWCL